MPRDKAFPDNPYHFTFYAVLFWGLHTQRADETKEIKDAAIGFLSRPANVAYNWVVIMNEEGWTCVGKWFSTIDWKHLLYEDLLKDAHLFRMLLPVHFGLKGFLVELLKRYTRPAENTLDTITSRLACYAARRGHEEILRLLLTHQDVDWDLCDSCGDLLLSLVDEDTLRILLQKENCSANATDRRGSALHEAVGHDDPSRARILLEAGADVGSRNEYGRPIIEWVMWTHLYDASWREMMDLLLEYKADINAHDPEGRTALHVAVECPNCGYAVEYLVSKGANLNLPNRLGETPLDILEEGAATNYGDEYGSGFDYDIDIQIFRKAGGKTAKEISQSSIGEQGPSFPSEWLERLKDIQELKFSFDRANSIK